MLARPPKLVEVMRTLPVLQQPPVEQVAQVRQEVSRELGVQLSTEQQEE